MTPKIADMIIWHQIMSKNYGKPSEQTFITISADSIHFGLVQVLMRNVVAISKWYKENCGFLLCSRPSKMVNWTNLNSNPSPNLNPWIETMMLGRREADSSILFLGNQHQQFVLSSSSAVNIFFIQSKLFANTFHVQ